MCTRVSCVDLHKLRTKAVCTNLNILKCLIQTYLNIFLKIFSNILLHYHYCSCNYNKMTENVILSAKSIPFSISLSAYFSLKTYSVPGLEITRPPVEKKMADGPAAFS